MAYASVSHPSGDTAPEHVGKPIPDQDDPMTKPFWEAANRGQLVVQQCQSCQKYHQWPVGLCPNCLSDDLSYVEVDGAGRVYSYTVVRDQRIPAFDDLVPYLIASVQLDAAPEVMLLTNLPGTPIDAVHHGMPVRVEFEEIAPGINIPQFVAVEKE